MPEIKEKLLNVSIMNGSLITIMLFVTLWIAACNNNPGPVPAAIKEDSSLNVDTSSGQSNQIATITDGSVDSDSKDFMTKAATSNLTEISKAEAALKQAKNSSLKKFSKTIVDGHTQLNIKLKKIAHSAGLAFPGIMDSAQEKQIETLKQKQDKEFDVKYVNDMIGNIQLDIQYYTKASTSLDNIDLKNYAANALPILLKDLEALKAIKKDL